MQINCVKELKELIAEGKRLLTEEKSCHTEADRKALEDMISKAERALSGEGVPFVRNREFVQPGENEATAFAYERYTMAPTTFLEGKVYGHYGLKEAVRWFKEQDMGRWTQKRLEDRREEVREAGYRLLKCANPKNPSREIREELMWLEASDGEALAPALVRCINALHKFRYAGELSSEKEKKPLILSLDKKQWNQKQYRRIRDIAESTTLEESRMAYEQIWGKYSYDQLNDRFDLWGNTGRVINVIAPFGTHGARLSFCLPGQENEENGLGHILINGVKLFSAQGPEIFIPNADFGQEINENAQINQIPSWSLERLKGNAVCRQIVTKRGEACLYMCNPSAQDEAAITCCEILPLEENGGYTLYFRARQDGKFKNGLQASLEFLDGEGKVIDTFTCEYNRKGTIPAGRKALDMQCSAIVYAVEKDDYHAQKAKYELLTFLNDFCQGAEYWMIYNERPEGCDAYGAVQAGRIMCSAASTYSLLEGADVFTEEEKKQFYAMTDYLLRYCMDLRDRISMSKERVQRGSSNWQTDMCIGVAALMTVLPDFPDRKIWMYNAEAVLEAQLAVNLNADGSWPESIRYHHAALEHFASFFRMWKQETGEDWLRLTRLKDMFSYTIHTITPAYEFFNGRIGTPPFGDHKLGDGKEFSIFGLYVNEIAQLDKELADQMYWVWEAAGYPVKDLGGESLAAENLLYMEPGEYVCRSAQQLPVSSVTDYPDSGIYVFRGGEGEGKENYLAVMASPRPIGHGHMDQGSFILYYHNCPVIMDSGIEGYFDVSTQWHLSSYSHACLQFAASEAEKKTLRVRNDRINLNAGNYSLDRGWLDVPRKSQVLEVRSGESEDKICMEIEHPCGREKGIHRRTITFRKKDGIVAVKDRIENYTGKILLSLPLVMKTAALEKQTVHAGGFYGTEVDLEFKTPVERIYFEKGRTIPMFPCEEEVPMLLYVRAEVDTALTKETEFWILPGGTART